MGLDFSKAKPKAEETQTDTVVIPEQEIEAVTSYDIVADRQQMNTELVNSPEVDAIVSTVCIKCMTDLMGDDRTEPAEIRIMIGVHIENRGNE